MLESVAKELQIQIAVVDLSQPANVSLARKLSVRYTPTIVTYVNGKPLPDYLVGKKDATTYRNWVRDALAKAGDTAGKDK